MSKRRITGNAPGPQQAVKVTSTYAKQLPDEIKLYIAEHYKHQKRSKLMRKVGIRDKVMFNMICMELGLGA